MGFVAILHEIRPGPRRMLLVCAGSRRASAPARPQVERLRRRPPAGHRPRVRRAAVDSQRRRRPRQHQAQRRPAADHVSPGAASRRRSSKPAAIRLSLPSFVCPGPAAHSSSTRTRRTTGRCQRLETERAVHSDHAGSAHGGRRTGNREFSVADVVPARGASLCAFGLGRQGAHHGAARRRSTR